VQLTSIWYLYADGTPARLLASLAVAPGSQLAFSPDLRHVAYVEGTEGAGNVLVTDLESGETMAVHSQGGGVYGWAPDSMSYAFLAYSEPNSPQAQIGGLVVDETIPAHDRPDEAAIDVRWVGANKGGQRYLYLALGEGGWDLILAEIGGEREIVAAGGERPLAYDHN